MKQISRVDEIKRTEWVVHHGDNMIFLQDGATVDRIENLLEIRLNELNNKEDLFETLDSNMFVVI